MKVISELQGNYNEYLKFVEHCWENTTTFTSISELESNNLLIKEYYEVPNETTYYYRHLTLEEFKKERQRINQIILTNT